MKILLINTYDAYGGAAVACNRLLKALEKNNDVSTAQMLVQEKSSTQENIGEWANTYWRKKKAFLRFSLERLSFLPYEKDKSVRFAFSPANTGVDISQHPLVKAADIIHLHWINFGFLSIQSLQKLFQTGKPIVWTLHDMWAFTGGCHYAGTCTHFQERCGNCHFLRKPKDKDLSWRILQKKFKAYHNAQLHLVTCSKWLAQVAHQSSLFKRSISSHNPPSIQSIPNPIDTLDFYPQDKIQIRQQLGLPSDKFLVLFGAMNIADKRKGFEYFKQSLEVLKQMQNKTQQALELVIFGKTSEELIQLLPYPSHNLGSLSSTEKIAQAYNVADLFVIPSLEDNLPNTIMESLACGTPVVAFDTGGIPDMVVHQQNGYLAEYKSAEDLAQGIYWVWQQADNKQLAHNAHQKVLDNFSEESVSDRYIKLYKKILDQA